MKNKNKIFKLITFIFFFLLFFNVKGIFAQTNKEIEDLNSQILEKQKRIQELQNQEAIYEEKITDKQREITSLNAQINFLDRNISKTDIKIKLAETQIEQKNEEIKKIGLEIQLKENDINEKRTEIAEVLRLIYENSKKSFLEIFLLNNSLSDFFNQWQYKEKLQELLQKSVDKLHIIKDSLNTQKSDLETKKRDLLALQDKLEKAKDDYKKQQNTKASLLTQTKGAEKKFQSLLASIKAEEDQVNTEVSSLETEVRKKLSQQKSKILDSEGNVSLIWPVPSQYITCQFHDPDYIFRRSIGEHSGTDIRASQGTSVKAAASGYVARAKDAGRGYSYILIIHNNEISTLYGHVSKINVQEDTYVSQGQIIGLSGGLPGTRGAGAFSLGPHLHFEVRSNGIPVNPEDYLP